MAGDWPQWRYDAQRSAVSPDALPVSLKRAWNRRLPPSRPAWPPGQWQLQFDRSSHAIVFRDTVYLTSSANDGMMALDSRTGVERWRFSCNGPVRLAPVAGEGGVYLVSDDGCLYCLNHQDGSVHWRVTGAPDVSRRVMGNGRLISAWPARGGPVLADGKVYFAAGIWPFLGIFVHAVDGHSGKVIWTNSGDGTTRTIQPHGAPSFATVAPQGHLALTNDQLIVPGGRSVPAVYHRDDGRLLHFQYDGKRGHHAVFTDGHYYYCGSVSCALADGSVWEDRAPAIGTADEILFLEGTKLAAMSPNAEPKEKKTVDWKGKVRVDRQLYRSLLWEANLTAPNGKLMMRTGHQLWLAFGNRLDRYDLPVGLVRSMPSPWLPNATLTFDAPVEEVLGADDRLFVLLADGTFECWSGDGNDATTLSPVIEAQEPAVFHAKSPNDREPILVPPTFQPRDEAYLKATRGGYALVWGIESGQLVETLLRETDWHIIVVENDNKLAQRWRRFFQDQRVYGDRIAILEDNRFTAVKSRGLPDCFATYVASERPLDGLDSESLRSLLLRTLRPYGGRMEVAGDERGTYSKSSDQRQYVVRLVGDWTRIERPGSIPGTDDWSHQYGNAGQTGISRESLVRVPLGLLWFGGPSHDGILPRHGHGPSPQVAGGRIVIEGPDCLRCLDVYTGRLFWEKPLPGLGKFYDNTKHVPGAGEIGSNYVTLADRIYVVYGDGLLELDAATGDTCRTYRLKRDGSARTDAAPVWGYLGVWGDYLVTTSSPVVVASDRPGDVPPADTQSASSEQVGAEGLTGKLPFAMPAPSGRQALTRLLQPARFASGSRRLHVFDRKSGQELWSRDAEFHFRHNAIALGNGRLFCIDRLSDVQVRALKRRGYELHDRPSLKALDLATGELLWETQQDVFGTFLNYSEEHDVLLQGGSVYRDRAYDESDKGMSAYAGSDGQRIWFEPERVYGGPCLLWKDRIISNGLGGTAYRLLDGTPVNWEYRRDYGCNTAIGCQNLLTFRSGAAGFCDLANDSGTGTLGGFRSSCTNNLIPANGVLAAPDYTRTCNCAYQNQTSIGFVHWPDAEFWTFGGQRRAGQWGINWGAPGDRRAENGTLWTDLPDVGGPSPVWDVKWEPAAVRPFRLHSSLVAGEAPWICASGVEGIQKVVLPCESDRPHRLRLYFCEPIADTGGAKRIFDVKVQGNEWLTACSPEDGAGATRKGWMREAVVQPSGGLVTIEFLSRSILPPLICGMELLEVSSGELP